MRVLVDTDVLLDLALAREPFAGPAAALLDWLADHPGTGFMAWHSASNFYYLVAGDSGKRDAVRFLGELLQFVDVAPVATSDLAMATQLDVPDFEDAMQIASAMACRAERIITRNLRHYRRSPVPAVAPSDALRSLKRGLSR